MIISFFQKKKLPHKSSHKNKEGVREKYPARERQEKKKRDASSEEGKIRHVSLRLFLHVFMLFSPKIIIIC